MAVTEYTWNPLTDSVIEETDGAGNVLVEYTNEPAPYGPLISEHRGAETRQYHFDALGSTRALTDDSQVVTDTFAYDAWGNQLQRDGDSNTLTQWVGIVGYQTSLTNLPFLIRHRLYTALTARWMSHDPLSIVMSYMYVDNTPLMLNDVSGMQPEAGDAVCQGIPSGVVFVPGRGSFWSSSLAWQGIGPGFYIDSLALINWLPRSRSSFIDKDGCCCCDSIGFIQIFKQTVRTSNGLTNLWYTHEWTIDNLHNHESLLYPFQDSIAPCRTGVSRAASMNDGPNVSLPTVSWRRVYELSQEFETCVVCVDGIEGQNVKRWRSGDDRYWRWEGLTVYGCMTWSQTRTFEGLGSTTALSMDNRFRIWNSQSVNPTRRVDVTSYDGTDASPVFKRLVLDRTYGI